jgi:hypothetical protein
VRCGFLYPVCPLAVTRVSYGRNSLDTALVVRLVHGAPATLKRTFLKAKLESETVHLAWRK